MRVDLTALKQRLRAPTGSLVAATSSTEQLAQRLRNSAPWLTAVGQAERQLLDKESEAMLSAGAQLLLVMYAGLPDTEPDAIQQIQVHERAARTARTVYVEHVPPSKAGGHYQPHQLVQQVAVPDPSGVPGLLRQVVARHPRHRLGVLLHGALPWIIPASGSLLEWCHALRVELPHGTLISASCPITSSHLGSPRGLAALAREGVVYTCPVPQDATRLLTALMPHAAPSSRAVRGITTDGVSPSRLLLAQGSV
ncbi:hypothetical protein ACIP5N_21490 [Streptomyces sp. NPDC088768]|uniref:hypothetical protein n=1 Tax=Streptomyces sp. NPDC088768 TaxID=3365894 RepID=UPI003810F331